jgi:hypothetical protein
MKRRYFNLTVRKPAWDHDLKIAVTNYDEADKAARELRQAGATVTWERHGYSLYAKADDVLEAVRWHA